MEGLRVTRSLTVPESELRWRFTGSGGPGGQHANTANTRVELLFDIEGSPSLGPRQRARLLEKLGAEVRVVASDERSQSRNRDLARVRLAAKLAEALHVPKARRASRPTAGSKRRRLDDKKRQSERKANRSRPRTDD